MKRSVVWSQKALNDITEQATFIARDSKVAAMRVARTIEAAAERLGVYLTGRPGRYEGTYEKSVTGLPFVIVYTVVGNDAGEVVFVAHVFHTSRNWQKGGLPKA